MRPTPYVASLRVYEPITSFEPHERAQWEQIPLTASTGWDEQNRALRRTIIPESPSTRPDGAHILEFNGKRYVSPWSTAARCWAALENFKSTLPMPLTKFFIPQRIEDAISLNSDMVEDKVSHIITETWMVPPRWFSLFKAEERIRGRNDDGPFTVYRTSIKNAKERCMFTHQAVVRSFGEGPIEAEIADLLEWMAIFDNESIMELDYGGLAFYLEQALIANGEGGLDADTSVEDIAISLGGLAAGDGGQAGVGYERLVSRWRRVAAYEQAM